MPRADGAAELTVSGLSAGYGETTVIREVDLTVAAGETLVVVGPNGHGKTTLMRAVSGLIGTRGGTIALGGDRIEGLHAEAVTERGLIHIPQGDHLFPDLTVEENLLMGAFLKSAWRERAAALAKVYALFGVLEERRAQRASSLSGGERRQVAIGRGLMRRPRLLIVDEPSLGLAPVVIENVYGAIAEIARQGDTSLLLVEENFSHIEDVADRVCVLEMGRIVAQGRPQELAGDATIAQSYLGVLE